MRRIVRDASEAERHDMEDWAFGILETLNANQQLDLLRMVGPKYGIDPEGVVEFTTQLEDFAALNSRPFMHTVVPNLLRLGLISERRQADWMRVGMMTAKAVALVHDRPLIAVNHLAGHALPARLTDGLDYPYLLLLVSGGHCQLLAVSGPGAYRRYGTTLDDAVGEAFDKTAKLLGLPYPGGPAVEQAAKQGQRTSARRYATQAVRNRPARDRGPRAARSGGASSFARLRSRGSSWLYTCAMAAIASETISTFGCRRS